MFYNSQVKSPVVVTFGKQGGTDIIPYYPYLEENYKFYINSEKLRNKVLRHECSITKETISVTEQLKIGFQLTEKEMV